ncbi:MAG: trigger factor [Holosporales bacterium]|jgi:trigger factor|nr:trigger factor [Holosporales bacterium]
MKIVEKSKDGLNRVYNVTFPAEFISQKVDERLRKIGEKARIAGFRVGKAPLDVIKRNYYSDALAEQINASAYQAIEEIVNKFKIDFRLKPKVTPNYDEKAGDLAVEVEIETQPTINVSDLSKMKVTTYKIKIGEEDAKRSLDDLKKRYPNWVDTSAEETAQNGHLVEFSCIIRSHRKSDKPQKYSDAKAVIGQSIYEREFDEHLIGKKKGDKIQFTVTLPRGHKLAGTKIDYNVNVKGIKVRSQFDDITSLAKAAGKAEDELKSTILKEMEGYYADQAWLETKRQVLDWLASKCDFPVSKPIVENEFNNLWAQVQKSSQTPVSENKALQQEYMDIAEKRVKVGFVLEEIGKLNKISEQPHEIKAAIEKMARSYGTDKKSMYDYCISNDQMLRAVKFHVFQDKVIQYMLSQANTAEKEVTPAEVIKFSEDYDTTAKKVRKG